MTTLNRLKAFYPSIFAITLIFCGARLASAATDTWSSTPAGANWNSTDWTGGNAPPQANDSLVFGSSSTTTLNNNFPALTPFYGLTFAGGSAFTLNGNSVLLSGGLVTNHVGVANNSGFTQTLGTMLLTLDSGYYTFSSSGTLALNGGLTLNPGGVAYFDANNTSSSLVNDASGLISGLGGAGLIYNGLTFTGLATMSGSSITTYSAFPSVVSGASGVIGAATPGAAVNVELTGTAAGNYTLTGGTNTTYFNSIFLSAASSSLLTVGSAVGVQTIDMGAVSGIGGIYLPAGNTVQALKIGSGSSTILTAGPMTGAPTPGTIVFGANGANTANEVLNNSTITDNGSGGKVSIVYVGTGSMISGQTLTNTYTGGTYILQGQYQGNALQLTNGAGSFGTGPIYVASGATAFLAAQGATTGSAGGVFVNDFYLSPGNGTTLETGTTANPGSLLLTSKTGTNFFYTGKMTLLGAPVSIGTAGDRLTGDADASSTQYLAGQITGTGTLDLNCSPHAVNFMFTNVTANANNWQGGLIIEETLAGPSSARNIIVKLGANNQIPSGANAGNVTLSSADASVKNSIVRLDLNGHNNTINGLNAVMPPNNFPVQVDNFGTGSATLTVGANNATGNFVGVIADGGVSNPFNLAKIGSGTQTISGVNTYVGSTTVSAGTLAIGSGSIAASPAINIAAPGTFDVMALGTITIGSAQTVNGIGAINGSVLVNGGINPFFGAVGTLTANGNVTFNSGSTFVWDLNNANGTAGTDNGWSLLSVAGGNTLTIAANSSSPMILKIVSLTAGEVAGNAANFSNSGTKSWVIAKSTMPISGFTPSAFTINTSAFSNPLGSGAFSLGLSGDQLSIILTFTGTPAISTPLVNQTNNAGTTATFTVVANGATAPITFQWLQGSNPLSNGGTSASGGAVTIVNSGHTSTLTIANVQDADMGGFTVNVSDNIGDSGTSSATLTVIDAPSNVNLASSQGSSVSGGAGVVLTATASGTAPFTYIWSLNGVVLTNSTHIQGANTGTLTIAGARAADEGNYTVEVINAAGNSTSSAFTLSSVTQVPNQLVYETFNYPLNDRSSGNPTVWTAYGVTNIYNQATGVGLGWVTTGNVGDISTLVQSMFDNTRSTYPIPGLAGTDPNEMYEDSDVGTQVNLPLGTGGSITNGSVYFSAVMQLTQGGQLVSPFTTQNEFVCGFGTGASTSTTHNTGIYISEPGNDTFSLGVFKTSGATSTLAPGVNGGWSSQVLGRNQILLVVCRLTIRPGITNDTCDLWINPPASSYYASETNLPAADVANAGAGAPDIGNVDLYYHKFTGFPASKFFSDVRIGLTWASVTPPAGPTLSLANQAVSLGSTAVLMSQNAGNPATSYSWSFNGGPALSDNGHITGSMTDTLTISNVQPADLGVYTVTAMNSDQINDDPVTFTNLTGSASATLSVLSPVLHVTYSAPNTILSWSTNFSGYTLQQSSTVLRTGTWTTSVSPPYAIVGTNYVVTNIISGTKFFRLIK